VFGNISDDDIERTVRAMPQLCAPGATVVWTRGRWAADVTAAINSWFAETGFAPQALEAPDDVKWTVGVHRLTVKPVSPAPGYRLFTFTR